MDSIPDLAMVLRPHSLSESLVEDLSRVYTLASQLHEGQVRTEFSSGAKTPYIAHPLRVMETLLIAGLRDRRVLLAALLHDVVEDCSLKYSRELELEVEESVARSLLLSHIEEEFGGGVASIVVSLTNEISLDDLTGEARQVKYRAKVQRAVREDHRVFVVKLADFLDNAGALPAREEGEKARVTRLREKYKPLLAVFHEALTLHGDSFEPAVQSYFRSRLDGMAAVMEAR